MKRFEGRTFLIVGASSGIGLATARRLASEGAAIVAIARREDRLAAAVASLEGAGHQAVVADAASYDALKPAIETGKQAGGYAGAVCCAGLHEVRPLAVLDEERLRRGYESNVVTAVNTTRALAQAARREGASVVWLSSVAAIRGTAGFLAYSAAKGALMSAARVAAAELSRRKIRVNVILGGVVEGDMSDGWLKLITEAQRQDVRNSHLLGLGRPDDVAGPVAFLLSDDAAWITGATLAVDGGLSVR